MTPVTSAQMLGSVLRHYRKNQGLTQAAAGRKLNLPQKTVSRMEAGTETMRLDTLFRYMSALGLEMHLESRTGNKLSDDETLW